MFCSDGSMLQDDHFLAGFVNQLPGMTLVMDSQSNFTYANDYTAKLFGYSTADSLIGKNAYGMLCPAVKCAEEFIQQDGYVRENRRALALLDIHQYATNEEEIFITNKVPFMQKDKAVGSICHCTHLQPDFFGKIATCLIQSDKKYYGKDKQKERSYTIGEELAKHTLAKRELDCVFYLARGKTMKEIGKFLNISWRTVESYLMRIKLKWNCKTKGDIIDYAITHGYLNYIPKEIMTGNISFILD